MAELQIQVYSHNIADVSKDPRLTPYYNNVIPAGDSVLCTNPPSRIFNISKGQDTEFKRSVKKNYPLSIIQENVSYQLDQLDQFVDLKTYYKDCLK